MKNVTSFPGQEPNLPVSKAVFEMELPLAKAQSFASVILHLGACPNQIEPSVLYALGSSLREAIGLVFKEWETAVKAIQSGAVR